MSEQLPNTESLDSPSDIRFNPPSHNQYESYTWTEYPEGYLISENNRRKEVRVTFSVRQSELKNKNDERMLHVFESDVKKTSPDQIRQAIFDHYRTITTEGLPPYKKSILDDL